MPKMMIIILIEEKSDKIKSTVLASLKQTIVGFENIHDVVQVSLLPKPIHLRFSSSQREAWCPRSSHSPHCPPQPGATTDLLSVSMDLPMGDISYKWNVTRLWPFPCGSFRIKNHFPESFIKRVSVSISFCLNNISLHGWTSFCLSVQQWLDICVVSTLGLLQCCYECCYTFLVFNHCSFLGHIPWSEISGSNGRFYI